MAQRSNQGTTTRVIDWVYRRHVLFFLTAVAGIAVLTMFGL